MFIWTVGDLIGAVLLGLGALFFGTLFLLIKISDWQARRKSKATNAARK